MLLSCSQILCVESDIVSLFIAVDHQNLCISTRVVGVMLEVVVLGVVRPVIAMRTVT